MNLRSPLKILKSVFSALLVLLSLAACAATTRVNLRINGIEMPAQAQAEVFSLRDQAGTRLAMTVFYYFVCTRPKKIKVRGSNDVIMENRPLDFQVPKKLPGDTKMVGIRLFVYNPEFLKFRVVKEVSGDVTNKDIVYQGVRNYFNAVLEGPVEAGKQFELAARIELMRDDGFVADSGELGDLVYTVSSSGYADSDRFAGQYQTPNGKEVKPSAVPAVP